VVCLGLAWLYALASQIIIPLPWNFVPISLQPLPVFLSSLLFGWPAVYAYLIYYIQGAFGAPFFAGMLGGMSRIVGPTGGYLIGFGLSAVFLAATRHWKQQSRIALLAKLYCAYAITFACGLAQLAWFVHPSILLSQGLYPFLIGDLIIKTGAVYGALLLKKSS
jgi:biotin transport system substrate-specific component